MADTHDTIDGLLAEFRGYAAGMPDSYHVTMSWADFRKMLDRLDAAHKREVDALKQRCKELDAEVAAKDEVIKRLNDAIAEEQRRKMAATENSSAVGDGDKSKAPDPVAYAIEGFKKDPAIMQMYEQMNVGNLAKLREAAEVTLTTIKKCMDILNSIPSDCGYDGLVEAVGDELCGLRDDFINAALAAPARNCDKVKTSWDVLKEWHEGLDTANDVVRLLDWLLAPATEQEGGNDADE